MTLYEYLPLSFQFICIYYNLYTIHHSFSQALLNRFLFTVLDVYCIIIIYMLLLILINLSRHLCYICLLNFQLANLIKGTNRWSNVINTIHAISIRCCTFKCYTRSTSWNICTNVCRLIIINGLLIILTANCLLLLYWYSEHFLI